MPVPWRDKVGAGRVLFVGALLVALGTFITPMMTSTAGLIFSIGVVAAGGAGMAGPAVLMAATSRMIPSAQRGLGWASAMQVLGLLVLLALPAAFLLNGNSAQSASAGQKPVGCSTPSGMPCAIRVI